MDRIASALERLTDGLARSTGYASAETTPAPPLTIALSRQAGTPGTSVAHAVAERLGWEALDHELLERIAREHHLRVRLLERLDEKRHSWVLGVLESWGGGPSLGESGFVHHLVETVAALAQRGGCVIVGRGVAHFLPRETTLRVRLVAPRDHRIAAFARQNSLSRDEAARRVETVEGQRNEFVTSHFHRDPTDPANYDLVLNTDRWSVQECAEQVSDALRKLEKKVVKG
jgi:cytidylate kinase